MDKSNSSNLQAIAAAITTATILLCLHTSALAITTNSDLPEGDDQDKSINLFEVANQYLEMVTGKLEDEGFRSTFQIGNIDPHFLDRNCAHEVETSLRRPPIQTESNTIFMKCREPSWQIYIPVDIQVFGKAIVSSTNIHKNSIVLPKHLEYKEIQVNKARYGSYSDITKVSGMRAKRTIRKGTILKSSLLQPPRLISRGDEVVIVAKNSQIAIRMKGKALSEGVLGEQIDVENLSSKRIIRAQVIEKGKVSVIL